MRLAALVVALTGCGGSSSNAPPPPLSSKPPPESVAPSEHPPTGPHAELASIHRTMCFGWCPAYTATVFRDGTMEYMGDEYVKTIGAAKVTLTGSQLSQLEALFTKAHYLELKDAYTDYNVTDMPSCDTSYTPPGGKTKRIEHYYGDGTAPEALSTIESGFDKIVHIETLIGTEKEREALGRGGD